MVLKLFTRAQEVRIENNLSRCKPVATGIGQGTIIGQLIFIFHINDVITNVSDLKVNMYADDCLVYTIGANLERMAPKIQDGLGSVRIGVKVTA